MRILAALALVALVFAPTVLAQLGTGDTLSNPVRGSYYETYVITGRVIDSAGGPVVHGAVDVKLEAPGVTAAPVEAGTDCFGTFITYFTIRNVDPRGKITVTAKGEDGQPAASGTASLDPFMRRSDVNLTLPQDWTLTTTDCDDTLWGKRVTMTGRMLTRTEPYDVGEHKFDAQPVPGHVRLRYWRDPARFECPPARTGSDECEPILIDERGDYRYSWVFLEDQPPVGFIEVMFRDQSWNFTVDPQLRYALGLIETTGRGAPPIKLDSPGAPFAALLAGIALAAIAGARVLAQTRARR